MKNTSFRTQENRRPVSNFSMSVYKLSLIGRLILETFIRRDFGRRYYSLRQALILAFLLLCRFAVAVIHSFPSLFGLKRYIKHPAPDFSLHYASWLAFTVFFVICAFARKLEARKNKGNSLSMGYSHPLFFKIRLFGRPLTDRFIETIVEPFFCLTVGLVLYLLTQPIGMVIMVCSAFYSISYIYAYRFADEVIMDMQDAGTNGEIYRNAPMAEKKPSPKADTEDVL